MTLPDRRHFLQSSATLAASLAALEAMPARAADPADDDSASKKAGPNDAVRVAMIGVKGRGMEHIQGYSKLKEARITTICDVDRNVVGRATKAVETAINESRPEVRAGPSPRSR